MAANANRVSLWGTENVLELDGSARTACEMTKTHWIAHFKSVNFMVPEFYLSTMEEEEADRKGEVRERERWPL